MRKPSPLSFLTVSGLVFALSCGFPEPDENSGRDVQRAGAQTIPLDTAVTDAVNHAGGDSTDWKVFEITDTGEYTIELFWDNPYVESEFNLHDQYGTRLETVGHRNASGESQLVISLSEVGLYYIRIFSEKNRTTYSVRVYPGVPRGTQDTEEQDTPIPVFDRPI